MSQPKKIVIYVHDLFIEIGHSNAIIETINQLGDDVSELVVVAYSSDNLEKLFPSLKCSKKFLKVPFEKIYPLLFKMLFFYCYGLYLSLRHLDKSYTKIGIGISYLWADIINVQFVHKHWGEYYFDYLKKDSFKYWYKKVLFFFFNIFESYVFSNPSKRFSSLSKFTTNYLLENYPISKDSIVTAYSGVNLDKFKIDQRIKNFEGRKELQNELAKNFPSLKELDISRPIYLFVGAFERKGLSKILDTLKKYKGAQLIVVGKPESKTIFSFPKELKIFHIPFTRDLPKFYSLADSFVFASIYEPFGLVIIEAAAMGLELFVTTKNVGACELLENMEGVHLFNDHTDFEIRKILPLSFAQRQMWIEARGNVFKNYDWNQTANLFKNIL